MNPLDLLKLGPYLPQLIALAPTVKEALDIAQSNDDAATKIKQMAALAVPLLDALGGQFFPRVAPALRVVAAAAAAFDPNTTRWLQSTLNLLDPSLQLEVDGLYGPLTKAAVEQFQETHGLTVDGWAGQLTQQAVTALLAKLQPEPA